MVALVIVTVVLLIYANVIPVYYSSTAKQLTTSGSPPFLNPYLNQTVLPNRGDELADDYSSREWDDDDDIESGRIRYKHTHRRLPHAIIIGARKAGTRALLTFMNMHPQVQVAKNEVHFFDDDQNYGYGYEWYRKKMPFSFPGQITMEKSPAYFVSDVTPARLHAMNSSVKLLLIVRDPVERAVSDYLQIKENKMTKGKPVLSFEELAIDQNTGEVDSTYNPIKRSIYFRYMRRWLEYFPLEQFLIISGEQLVRDPATILQKVEKFLGIEHRLTAENFYYNESRGFYCLQTDAEKRCLVESKGRPHPPMDPIVQQKLQNFFRPFNHRFYRLVQRDFGWP